MFWNRGAALSLSTGLAVLALAACSESITPPSTPSGLAVGDTPAPTPAPAFGKLVICKTGNTGGSFDVTRVAVNTSSGQVSGLNTQIAVNTCYEVANDQSPPDNGSVVTVDEDAAANTVQTVASCMSATSGAPLACTFTDGGSLFVNSQHGYVVVYNNQMTDTHQPPPTDPHQPPPPPPTDPHQPPPPPSDGHGTTNGTTNGNGHGNGKAEGNRHHG